MQQGGLRGGAIEKPAGSIMPQLVCPTCRKRVSFESLDDVPHRPFCSRRCQLVDLGKWLNEEYRVSEPLDGTQDVPPEPSAQPDRRDS